MACEDAGLSCKGDSCTGLPAWVGDYDSSTSGVFSVGWGELRALMNWH